MKISLVHKISLTAVFLVVVSVSLSGGLFYVKSTNLLLAQAVEDISDEIKYASSRLLAHTGSQKRDVNFLANISPVQQLLQQIIANTEGAKTSEYQQSILALQSIFSGMLKSEPSYLKIRFIDNQGQERVVVGRENNKIEAINNDSLQSKAKRTYVIETLKLARDEVYLSEINLNREFGKITVPHLEVLRTSTPVFNDLNGQLSGLILITAEISHELKNIQQVIQKSGRKIYITNDRGGYLLHPDKNKAYGFDLGTNYRIQDDIPSLAPLYSPNSKDENTVLSPDEDDGFQQVNFSKVFIDPVHKERFIGVAISQPYDSIVAQESSVLNQVLYITIGLAFIVMIFAIMLSFKLFRPIKQITEMMNQHGENKNVDVSELTNKQDEIGMMARSFLSMIKKIDLTQKKSNELNDRLENIVHERTSSLEKSEEKQRAILETIADAIITIDRRGLIASFNPAAEIIFGYSANEVIGNNVSMLMPESERDVHHGYTDNSSLNGSRIINKARDLEGLRKDGSLFPLELNVTSMASNNFTGFVGILRDITERKQMDKMKNEFISTVSHELRTPLTSIRGSLGLISGGAVGELPEKAKELLRIAGNNTERLLLLINDILDIQKIESGELTFKFHSHELMKIIKRVVEENTAYAEQHNVVFNIVEDVSDILVYVDEDRFHQVMANLLSNAAKFSSSNDTIEIVVSYRRKNVRVAVTDHGVGIPESFQAKLFDKFTQSDSSDTRKKGGTGLGLSISKTIIEKMGGEIGFVSKEGIGSTFYIDLPADIKINIADNIDITDNTDKDFSSSRKQQPYVLIVEDDHDIAALIQRMLAEAGYNSHIAYDAIEARQKLADNPNFYKAITLDLVLPGEDGIQFLERMRRFEDTHDIPVVVVSVKADKTKRKLNGSAMGVVDWLQKPIDQNRLIDAVKMAAASGKVPKILHVEDDSDIHKVVSVMLQDHCKISWATTVAKARKCLKEEEFDMVLLDIGLPDGSGLDILGDIERNVHPPKVVIFSANEVSAEDAKKVSAVLMKSKTDNFKLADVINSVIRGEY